MKTSVNIAYIQKYIYVCETVYVVWPKSVASATPAYFFGFLWVIQQV